MTRAHRPGFAPVRTREWSIVAVCSLVVFLVSGARSSFTVFITPMEQELGWTRASISAAAAINLVVYGVTQPLAGILVNRLGAKAVLVGGTLLAAAGFGGLFWVPSIWYLSIFYGLLFGMGVSFASLIPASVLVARWFDRRQGMAHGIVTAARPGGQIVFVPAAAAVLLAIGWRQTYLLVGAALIVSIPLVLRVVRDKPDTDDSPRRWDEVAAARPTSAADAAVSAGWTRSYTFWALAVGFFACGFTDQFVAVHLVPFAQGIGISSVTAANAFAVLSAAGVVGSVLVGWLSDILSRTYLLTLVYGLRVASLPLLLFVTADSGLFWLYLFAIVFGFTFIANMAPAMGIIRGTYGVAATSLLVGWLLFGHQIGGAAGTYAGGILYEVTGGYDAAFILMATVALVGAAFTLRLSGHVRQSQ